MASRTSKGRGVSRPPYSLKHSGPCIVAGNAFSLNDDLANARKLYPDAPAIAVNGAARHVKAVALFSKHPQFFTGKKWIYWQQQIHDDFTVNSSTYEPDMPWVDHWWKDASGGGSSAWGARKLAWLMGYDPVILVGAPLESGGYSNYEMYSVLMRDQPTIDRFRAEIEAEPEWHEGATSMSGWTRDFLSSAS